MKADTGWNGRPARRGDGDAFVVHGDDLRELRSIKQRKEKIQRVRKVEKRLGKGLTEAKRRRSDFNEHGGGLGLRWRLIRARKAATTSS